MASPEHLIPDSVKSLVGKESPVVLVDEVARKRSVLYCRAVGESNPLYLDEKHARESGCGGLVAPPMLLFGLARGDDDDVTEDGFSTLSPQPPVDLPLKRAVLGGQKWEFLKPLRVGDVITAKWRLADVYERQGKTGTMVIVDRLVTYLNQEGETIATCNHVEIVR